jgi:hypothetical protein
MVWSKKIKSAICPGYYLRGIVSPRIVVELFVKYFYEWKSSMCERVPQDPNLFWVLQKNEISRRSSHKIVVRSHSSEDLQTFSSEHLLKILERKDLKKNFLKILERKRGENLSKICINFLWKIFWRFYEEKIFKNFLWRLQDLMKITILLEIYLISRRRWASYLWCGSSK